MTNINSGSSSNKAGILSKFNFIFWFTAAITLFSGIAARWLSNDSQGFGQIADFFGGLILGFVLSLFGGIILVINLKKDSLDKLLLFSFLLLIADILFLVLPKIIN